MNFRKLSRRLLSLLMVAAMLVSICAPVVSAASHLEHLHKDQAGDEKLHYVSLGASNTNGYGHHGYLDPEIYEDPLAANKNQMNDYGYDKAPANAYPALIRDALAAKTGREVELHQLAISSMRVEEVLWLLDDTFEPDEYMNWRFTGGKSWFDMAHKEGGREALRVEYREYIANADVISVDLGWNNFGVYAFNNIMTILKDNRFWKAPDFEKVVDAGQEKEYYAIRDKVVEGLSENMKVSDTALDGKIEMLADVLAYAAFGACYNFDKVMGRIYELNPDAEVVVINIQNLADELILNLNGNEIPIGDLYGELIELVDFYRASLSPYSDKYSFAYAGEDGDVDTFLDEFRLWDGDPATLSQDMKDLFDMYDDNLYVRSKIEYIMVGQVLSGLFDTFRKLGASYGLSVFRNDDNYVYEFALDMDWLNGVDLGALDFNNPDTPLEEYGAALSKHLVNLRNYEGEGKYAYNYIFEDLINSLTYQKTQVTIQKSNAEVERAGLVAQKDVLIEKKAELEAQLEITSDPASKAELEAAIATYDSYITQYNEGIAQYDAGIAQAEAGIAQLEEAITNVIPVAKQGFDNTFAGIYGVYTNTLNYAYDTVGTIIQYSLQFNTFYITPDSMANHNQKTEELLGYVVETFTNNTMLKFYEELGKIELDNSGAVAPEITVDTELFEDPLIQAVAALEVRYDFGNSFFAHPSVKGNKQICDAVMNALENGSDADGFVDEKIDDYIGAIEDKLNDFYEEKYDELVQNGTIDEILGALDKIEDSMNSLEDEIRDFDVSDNIFVKPEREQSIKDLIFEEIENLKETINGLRDVLNTGSLSFDANTWSELVKAQQNLEKHAETLGTLGLEIGFVAGDHIVEISKAVEIQAEITQSFIVEGYTYLLETVEGFYEGYVEFAELAGSYAANIDPEFGKAVRDYIIETPAQTVNILVVYGEEAILKLIVDAAAAAGDIYSSISAIIAILGEHGDEIYKEIVSDEEYKELTDAIEDKANDIVELSKQAQETPILTIIELEEIIARESADLAELYSKLISVVIKNVEKYDEEVAELLWTALTDAANALGVITQSGAEYIVWLDSHADALLGALLHSFIESTDELYNQAKATAWKYICMLDAFVTDTYEKIHAHICLQIAVLKGELAKLESELEALANEKIAEIEASIALIQEKIAELEAKISALNAMIKAGVEDVKNFIFEIERLIADINALVTEISDACVEISRETLVNINYYLNKIADTFERINAIDYAQIKVTLNGLALNLYNRALAELKEASPYIDEKLYNYLYNNPEEVIEFFKTYGPYIEKYVDERGEMVLSVISYLLYEYGEDVALYVVENPEEALDRILAWYDKYGVRIWPMVEVYLDVLGIEIGSLGDFDFDLDFDINDTVERLYSLIDELEAELKKLGERVDETINETINETIEKIYALIDELQTKLCEVLVMLYELGIEVNNEVLIPALDFVAQMKVKLEAMICEGMDKVEATLEEIKEIANVLLSRTDDIKAFVGLAINSALNGEYNPDKDSFYVAITGDNNAYAELIAGALGLGDKYATMNWNELDYSILANADFVTIGYDASAVNGFALDQLVVALALYGNESLRGQVSDYLYSVLSDDLDEYMVEEYVSLLDFAMISVLEHPAFAGKGTAIDWAELVGAENVAEIETALAEVEALLEEKGIDGNVILPVNVADLVAKYVPQDGFTIDIFENNPVLELSVPVADWIMLTVEAYLYANISFQLSYAEAINEILAINPNAQIAVLGQYNPFHDFSVAGIEIPVAEIYEMIADVRSSISFAYALVLPNVTYVDISDVEAEWIYVENPADILDAYAENPVCAFFTKAGNVYVMNQVLGAYGLTCQHVYEDCDDKDCEICGYVREFAEHDYVAVVTKPDCVNGGYTTYTCSECGDTYVANKVNALGHKYDNACDADCNECGEKRTPSNHVFGDWTITIQPTDKADGERMHTCTICGYVEKEIIDNGKNGPFDLGVGGIIAIVIGSVVAVCGVTASVLMVIKRKNNN